MSFGGYRIYIGETGGLLEVRNPSGVIGPHGPKWWKRRGDRRWRAAPLAAIRIGKGKGAAGPLLLPSLHLLFPPSPSWNRKGRGQTYLK